MDTGNLFLVSAEDSVLAPEKGATANLVCLRWFEHRNRLLERHGFQGASAYPSKARFRFEDWRVGDVRYAADISVGIAGTKGKFTTFALDAGTPALL